MRASGGRWAQAQPLPRVHEPTTTTTPALPADIAGRREHTVAVHCRQYSLENATEWETYAGRGGYNIKYVPGFAFCYCYKYTSGVMSLLLWDIQQKTGDGGIPHHTR